MSSLSTASTSSTTTFTDTELTEVKRDFQSATELYRKNLASTTKLPALQSRIADLETEQSQPDFWDEANTSRAAIVNAQVSTATRLLTRIQAWQEWHGDAQAALEILSQSWTASSDDATAVTSGVNNSLRLASEERAMLLDEFRSAIARLREDSERFELELLLSGPYDHAPARLLLTAGAGGTEANDWVGDLKRMYQRHCEAMGLSCVVQDEQAGEAVGYKSVELLVSGENAYGWLQGEKGAHRMVRLSPFNANNKRQTTFAGVDVAPDILNQDDDAYWNTIDVPESELEITTMRAGGKGGQNVNKVNSAVRIKHLPSGLQVKCAQERSQSMNKNIALKRLKAQLLAIVQEQRVAEIKEIRGDMVEASWGAQIRNYVFHPYKMVKDQRTGWETSNVQAFMDGDLLEECIGSFLRHKAEEQRKEQIANE